MRTSVLCLALTAAALLACGAAYAKTSIDIGKPVCSHYDEPAKQSASPAVEAASSPATPTGNGVATTAPTPGPMPRSSSGGDSVSRPRTAPHWQTFLPGMFR